MGALVVLFLGYGVWGIVAEVRDRRARWPRIALAGTVAVVLIASYALYLI